MESYLTPVNIMFAIGILSVLFNIFQYFRKPQEAGVLNDALFAKEMANIVEKFETKFQDMKDGVVKVMQNDMQEIKSGMNEHIKNQIINEREVAVRLGSIATLLDERLPRK